MATSQQKLIINSSKLNNQQLRMRMGESLSSHTWKDFPLHRIPAQ